jgi:FkbM family methyltransferase
MGIITAAKTMVALYRLKIESPKEMLVHRMNKLLYGQKRALEIKRQKRREQLKEKYLKNDIWDFNGVKLPDYKDDYIQGRLISYVYMDTLLVYCNYNDNYDSKIVDLLDLCLGEGTYGYKNDAIDVTVKKGDTVIDAGAWIGDFSAYAAVKGAEVYAFEPGKSTVEYLKITRELNGNIHIVEKGLGNRAEVSFLTGDPSNSGSNKITMESDHSERIEITTIDGFVAEQSLDRVDFIKADIEGFERYMLMGAAKTLKTFAPKLAICTYHLPDDPEILAKIILDANPDYTIVQKRKKLYAMVKHQITQSCEN